jgi:hypothetical protein
MSDDYRLRADLQRIVADAGAAPYWNTASDKPVVPDRYTRAEVEAAVKQAIEACADEIKSRAKPHVRERLKMRLAKQGYRMRDPILARAYLRAARAIRALASDPAALERIINGNG